MESLFDPETEGELRMTKWYPQSGGGPQVDSWTEAATCSGLPDHSWTPRNRQGNFFLEPLHFCSVYSGNLLYFLNITEPICNQEIPKPNDEITADSERAPRPWDLELVTPWLLQGTCSPAHTQEVTQVEDDSFIKAVTDRSLKLMLLMRSVVLFLLLFTRQKWNDIFITNTSLHQLHNWFHVTENSTQTVKHVELFSWSIHC